MNLDSIFDRPRPLFPLGQIVGTPGALKVLTDFDVDPMSLIWRHNGGDWGSVDEFDARQNQFAIRNKLRILSSYQCFNELLRFPRFFVCHQVNFMLPVVADFASSSIALNSY